MSGENGCATTNTGGSHRRARDTQNPPIFPYKEEVISSSLVTPTARIPFFARDSGFLRYGRRYSTTELLATEQRVIEQALAGVEARLRRHRQLTDGQRAMVRQFTTSGNSIDIGIGPAGSGKTAVTAVIGVSSLL